YLDILFSYFILYYSSDIRDLHSFPTRRSSDLDGQKETKETKALEATGRLFSWLSYVQILSAPANRSMPDSGFYMLNRSLIRVIRDRKSTRLNSSHRTISYAVFCLKKKNK